MEFQNIKGVRTLPKVRSKNECITEQTLIYS